MACRKIVISGYYGYGNAGDEAILASMLQAVSKVVPDAQFCVLSGNPARTRKAFDVRAVHGKNLLAVMKELFGASLLVSGGGGLIQDSTGFQTIVYYLSIVSMARKFRKPVMFYAQGVGPVRTSQGRSMTRKVASKVQLITVRDDESKLLLEEIGVHGPPILVTADPVLALEPAEATRVDAILRDEAVPLDRPVVGLSIRPWPDSPQAEAGFVAVGRVLVERGFHTLIMPFQESQDRAVCERVRDSIGDGAQVLRNEYGPTELMGITGRLHAVIGMRLHALIFGAAQGIPVAGVAYDPKVANFLRRMEAPIVALEGMAPDDLVSAAIEVVQNAEKHRERVHRLALAMREKARENAVLLRELVEGGGVPVSSGSVFH